jgi:antitoxin ParD1/3/4
MSSFDKNGYQLQNHPGGSGTMNVSLTPELEQMIQEKVASGLYASASEVVREALRIMRTRDEARQQKLEELRRDIAEGLADLDAGRVYDADEVFAEIRADLEQQIREEAALG